MAKRKSISKKTRFEVFKRDSFKCQYCGQSAPGVILHVDHIHPVSKGGEDDLLNYTTACVECNLGKKARLLSDDSAVKQQKAQLDELQERREQLEMMIAWRDGLKNIEDLELQPALDACNAATPGFVINEGGMGDLRKWIKTFGLSTVLDSIETSKSYLEYHKNGKLKLDSVNLSFSKIGGICRMASQPEWKRQLYYIRGIARKRCEYFVDWQAMQLIEAAYQAGVSIDDMRFIASNISSWTQFRNRIEKAMDEVS